MPILTWINVANVDFIMPTNNYGYHRHTVRHTCRHTVIIPSILLLKEFPQNINIPNKNIVVYYVFSIHVHGDNMY